MNKELSRNRFRNSKVAVGRKPTGFARPDGLRRSAKAVIKFGTMPKRPDGLRRSAKAGTNFGTMPKGFRNDVVVMLMGVQQCKLATFLLVCLVLSGLGCNRKVTKPETPATPSELAISTPPLATPEVTSLSFTDATPSSGISFQYRNGEAAKQCTILESLGGGVAALDYDADGRIDLCFASGGDISGDQKITGLPLGLFRNLGDWKFADVSHHCGAATDKLYTHGVAAADYDNDGFTDLLVTGYDGIQLWTNQGDGTFVDSTVGAQFAETSWSTSAAWSDLDGDGVLDVYIAHYLDWSFANHPFCAGPSPGQRDICPPKMFEPLGDVYYLSNGDGTFRRPDTEHPLRSDGKGLGVLAADVDGDGDIDIYVANDTTDNHLYLNDGRGNFVESGLVSGAATGARGTPDGSMGVDLCDFNGDGRFDIWVANYERETFAMYRNEGSGQFLHVSQAAGVTALDGLFVGFGTACADFDHDGHEDIVVANGHVILFPTFAPRRQLPLLLKNDGQRLSRVRPRDGYFAEAHEGRGLAAVDLDDDGDLDVAISHLNAPAVVLRNDRAEGQWLRVRLVGRASNRDAIGAKLSLRTSQRTMHRQIKGGGSYLSTGDKRIFFGFPAGETAESLDIVWPSGHRQVIEQPTANQPLFFVEPHAP